MFRSDDFGYGGSYGRSRSLSPGLVLLGLGLVFLLWRVLSPTGALPLLVLGGTFTAVSFARGLRGFLIPGGILLGLGGGVVAAALLGRASGMLGAAAIFAGLGAGFWLIHAIERLRNPYGGGFGFARVPGTVMLGIAAIFAAFGLLSVSFQALGFLLNFWPLLLIAGGLWLFLAGRRRGPRRA